MTLNINEVVIAGFLGSDPELRVTNSGKDVCNVSIATNYLYEENGEQKARTEWHKVIVFGASAKFVGEKLVKGAHVYVKGRLQTRKWTDQKGEDRYITEIIADQFTAITYGK